MLDHPDAALLLQGLATFLDQDVRPTIDDRALSFRVLVASHLARSVAFEVQGGDAAVIAALERLGAEIPTEAGARRTQLKALHADLAARIRAGDLPEGIGDHVRACLRDELSLTNPRFDLSPDLP